ncbi:MAG: zinc ribbon domain-containing protein [Planctomycetaceae bacterium]
MPLFEYRCRKCGRQFEQLVRRGETASCPNCAHTQVEKLMSAAATRSSSVGGSLPLASACPPADAPPCGPGCCRLP